MFYSDFYRCENSALKPTPKDKPAFAPGTTKNNSGSYRLSQIARAYSRRPIRFMHKADTAYRAAIKLPLSRKMSGVSA